METQMKLEHKIELRWLILFALPTIFSNIFGNLYTAVDGIFVARFVDTDALSAINISMPMAYLASALGMMSSSVLSPWAKPVLVLSFRFQAVF